MRKGFTLVEILAVIAIIAVLVLIAVPTYNTISGTMKENVYNAKIEEIKAKRLDSCRRNRTSCFQCGHFN